MTEQSQSHQPESPAEDAVVEEAVVEEAVVEEAVVEEAVKPVEPVEPAALEASEPVVALPAAEPAPQLEPAPAHAALPSEPAPVPPTLAPTAAPVPSPAALGATVHAPAAPAGAASTSDAASFGRVEPDGTVYLRLPDGEEHVVGQYQAGPSEDALAYYVRKHDALVDEVELLTSRLQARLVPAGEAQTSLAKIREGVNAHAYVGDVAALQAKVEAASAQVGELRSAAAAEKSAAKADALAAREALVAEAESLADSQQWKSTGERLKTLLDEWKAAPRVDRAAEQALWKRFSAARNAFDRRRRTHFAALAQQRTAAKEAKEALVAEAEALSTSTDWGPTASQMRHLLDQWKAAGRADRSVEDALWTRFRAAQDAFFSARSGVLAERDAGLTDNLKAKDALIAEAEALVPVTDLKAAKRALRGIQERWEKAGHVPRADRDRIEGRLKRVEDEVRRAEESQWRRSNPEARARAEATATQLRASIAKLEQQAAAARAKGDSSAATEAEGAIAARTEWLAEAERALADFGG